MYTYWIVNEDFYTGKQGDQKRRISRKRPLRVGCLYAHLGKGCLGRYRVLRLIEEEEA